MDSFEKIIESQLPSMDKFYSNLNNDTINENDYEHALKVWKTFNINHLGEYHDFYLMTDVRRCGSETPQGVRGVWVGNFIGGALYEFPLYLPKYTVATLSHTAAATHRRHTVASPPPHRRPPIALPFFSVFQSDVLLSQAVTNDEQRLALICCGIVCNLKATIDLPLHSQRLRSRASLHTLGFAFLFSAPLLCASFFRWCMCCSAHTELFPLFFDYFFSSTCIV